jgi:molybdate transport system substrate-binding protein
MPHLKISSVPKVIHVFPLSSHKLKSLLACLFLILLGTGCAALAEHSAEKTTIIVSAPASMSDAMTEIGRQYEKKHPQVKVQLNFGSSGALKRQIEKGAPVDVYISAGKKEVDDLVHSGRIDAGDVRCFAGNTLVLIQPAASSRPLHSLEDLKSPEVRWIAIGDPGTVPAGRYAAESLRHAQLWNTLKPKLVLSKDVRQVLTYVENRHVTAGIVYRTDALTTKKVRIVQTLNNHQPILYCSGLVRHTGHPQTAKDFLSYLLSPSVATVLQKYGFSPKQP